MKRHPAFAHRGEGDSPQTGVADSGLSGAVPLAEHQKDSGVCRANLLERPLTDFERTHQWIGSVHRHGILTLAIVP